MSTERQQIQWLRYPEAERYIDAAVSQFVVALPPAGALKTALHRRTSTRLIDWIDHLVLADGDDVRAELHTMGFEPEAVPAEMGHAVFYHPGATFPRLLLREGTEAPPGTALAVAIGVERINAFLAAHHVAAPIEGTPLSPYRRATVWQGGGRALLAVERRGHRGFIPQEMEPDYPHRYLAVYERWATRQRTFDDPVAGMERTLSLAESLVGDLGANTAAWIAFAAERAHWQRRNRAGQMQRARQDQLGMGWANHDHHTFRSSRETFHLLIQILETFGFHPRERFYAGAEAGWGAQVMEQTACGFAVFADVDLSPEEVSGDFAHQPLPPRETLGTVGLWCALHGDSMLAAGLHHLAVRLDFDTAAPDLAAWGEEMMEPFSDFSYLRQAFTRGERWEVPARRLAPLVTANQIGADQRERFVEEGAVGSHLESIQRGEGFKGFNQQTVSDIIRRTDPRHESEAA